MTAEDILLRLAAFAHEHPDWTAGRIIGMVICTAKPHAGPDRHRYPYYVADKELAALIESAFSSPEFVRSQR